jgi:hypothetical protein
MLALKASTVVEDYAYIWAEDPAIDQTAEDWRELYDRAHEENDLSLLPLHPNTKPTVFWLRHPVGELRVYITDRWQQAIDPKKPSFISEQLLWLVAKHCLAKVENLPQLDYKKDVDADSGFGCVSTATMTQLAQVGLDEYGREGMLIDALGMRVLEKLLPSKN